jgi:hypothetical protein
MRVSVLKDHSNAAAFLSSTKVRIFRSDRRNSDRHCGPVLGFNAHLAIQFGIDLAKPPRMIAALACQAGGSAEATAFPALLAAGSSPGSSEFQIMTNNRQFHHGAHMLVGALRKTYGPNFAKGCADNERLSEVLAKDASLRRVIRDHEAGKFEQISRSWKA